VKRFILRKPSELNNGLAGGRKAKQVWGEEIEKNVACRRSKKQEDYARYIESA
jgi:hypothetical protein